MPESGRTYHASFTDSSKSRTMGVMLLLAVVGLCGCDASHQQSAPTSQMATAAEALPEPYKVGQKVPDADAAAAPSAAFDSIKSAPAGGDAVERAAAAAAAERAAVADAAIAAALAAASAGSSAGFNSK